MTVCAAVCEFNPFHNGHKYLLEKMKADNDFAVCIMSGNFVQRGEFAVCDKYIRAREAVRNGADLVIELPLPYAVSPAQTFAAGSVGVLDRLNIIDSLYFGAESSLSELYSVHALTDSYDFKTKLDAAMKRGASYPDAFFEAAGKDCLCGGNDILALEYISRLEELKSPIKPVAVKRKGNGHGSDTPVGDYASASYLRKLISQGENTEKYMPFCVDKADLSDFNKLKITVLSKLRQMNENDFAQIADVTEGLEYRLKKAISKAKSLDDFFEKVRTRRYTLSKIRRIILCSFLGVTKDMQGRIPSFVNVLACNENGAKLISDIRKKSDIIPVIRFSDTEKLLESDKMLYEFTSVCDDIFGLSLPEIRPTGYDKTHRFNII